MISFGFSCTSSSTFLQIQHLTPILPATVSASANRFAEAETVAGKIGVKCWICKKVEEEVQEKPKEIIVRSNPAPEVEAPAAV